MTPPLPASSFTSIVLDAQARGRGAEPETEISQAVRDLAAGISIVSVECSDSALGVLCVPLQQLAALLGLRYHLGRQLLAAGRKDKDFLARVLTLDVTANGLPIAALHRRAAEQPEATVSPQDLREWLRVDQERLAALQARRNAGEAILPQEIDMVSATIAQFEAELRYIAARGELDQAELPE